jgi:hypothetical protein
MFFAQTLDFRHTAFDDEAAVVSHLVAPARQQFGRQDAVVPRKPWTPCE